MNALRKQATRTAVSANGICKTYGKKVVLDGIDLSIAEGEVFAPLGPSGAGKTTTVRILSTLIPADAGTASVIGYDLRREADKVRAVIGVTAQFSTVGTLLTGEENLLLMGRLRHLPPTPTGSPPRSPRSIASCRNAPRNSATATSGSPA